MSITFHHLGIVVKDLDIAAKRYSDILGLAEWDKKIVEDSENGVRILSLPTGNTFIELIQPIRSDNRFARFLEERGEGLFHLCFFTEEFDKDIEHLVLEKTEGVPFFIEELINSFRDQKIIKKKDNKYYLAKDIRKAFIPTTIHDVIMARIDSLPERSKVLASFFVVVQFREDKRKSENIKINAFFMIPLLSCKC